MTFNVLKDRTSQRFPKNPMRSSAGSVSAEARTYAIVSRAMTRGFRYVSPIDH